MAILSSAPLQFVASIPLATRVITAATIVLSLFYYFLRWSGTQVTALPWLVLLPGSSIFYPWTFLTSAFVESTVLEVRATSFLYFALRQVADDYCSSYSRLSPYPRLCDT